MASGYTLPEKMRAASWPGGIRCRRTWWWECRTPAWTRRWDTLRSPEFPSAWALSKTSTIGRTLISPGQRLNQVRIKLSPIGEAVRGKRIVLIDDSIVRGTTSGQIVNLLREAGAREIHMRVSSPPFRNPCYYGTDIDSREKLIACQYSVEEIASFIGADSLGYLAVEDLKEMIGSSQFCHACFSGDYPTPIPENTQKDRFEGPLSQRRKE